MLHLMPASSSTVSPLLPLLREGGKKAQKSPARDCSQSCGAAAATVGTETSRELERWTQGDLHALIGQKDRCGE